MLMRRVRDRVCPLREPICIGTSATMVSEAAGVDTSEGVARVASLLFGAKISPDSVITESLARATDISLNAISVRPDLRAAVESDLSANMTDEEFAQNPLAIWIELWIGLDDRKELRRHKPITLEEAAIRLSEESGADLDRCRKQLRHMLIYMSWPGEQRGAQGTRAFLAFKLHRFISGPAMSMPRSTRRTAQLRSMVNSFCLAMRAQGSIPRFSVAIVDRSSTRSL